MRTLYTQPGHKRFHVMSDKSRRALCGLSLEVPSLHTKQATQVSDVTCPRCRNWLHLPEGKTYRDSIEGDSDAT
jgi:hypothetical protein